MRRTRSVNASDGSNATHTIRCMGPCGAGRTCAMESENACDCSATVFNDAIMPGMVRSSLGPKNKTVICKSFSPVHLNHGNSRSYVAQNCRMCSVSFAPGFKPTNRRGSRGCCELLGCTAPGQARPPSRRSGVAGGDSNHASAGPGFEPGFPRPERGVLPLDDPAMVGTTPEL